MQQYLASSPSNPQSVLPIIGEGLTLARGGRGLLNAINIEVGRAGGALVLLGPNGAGKSVLLRILAGLVVPDSGRVTWAGSAPSRDRAQSVGFVFQKPVLLRRTAAANIEYALALLGMPADERRAQAAAILERARLSHLASSPARSLSGGEQQRIAMARTLALRPGVLMLDEPTANLDPASTAAIENQISDAEASGTRIVMVTQDIGQARRLAGEVIFLHQGSLKERTPAADFFRRPQCREARAFLSGEIVL